MRPKTRIERVAPGAPESVRIDRLLYYLRFAKTRTGGARLIAGGLLRINGRRTASAHSPVRVGDVLTLPTPRGSRVIRVLALPVRRGPASEARGQYEAVE